MTQSVSNLLWTPAGQHIGDVTIVRVGDEYHLFTEQRPTSVDMAVDPWPRSVGHAVSKDLFTWETLPDAIERGPGGSFDGLSIFHMDVLVKDGRWYMFYTGLDRQGVGQRQTVALATSQDGIHWQKHAGNPILRADPRWYEQAIPPEAAYAEKDLGRLWFRDPVVVPLPGDQGYGMAVVARDKHEHPDARGCLAWATSRDLLQWEPAPPIFSPGRFHTIETPSLFEHDGRWYAIYMSHPAWGGSVITSDPYQNAGDFYAVSDHGPAGPYRTPADEVVVAAHQSVRMGAVRTLKLADGSRCLYGWLRVMPDGDDEPPAHGYRQFVPPPRRVRFDADGQLQVCFHEGVERYFGDPRPFTTMNPSGDSACWSISKLIQAKCFSGRSVLTAPTESRDLILAATIERRRGERAGVVLRCDGSGCQGWYAVADWRYRRIAFGLLDRPGFLDARQWQPRDTVQLKVVACRESVEVYADDRLMIHQARHRETGSRIGLLVENADAVFSEITVRSAR